MGKERFCDSMYKDEWSARFYCSLAHGHWGNHRCGDKEWTDAKRPSPAVDEKRRLSRETVAAADDERRAREKS